MRGPYERLKYDLRRVWECPVCQHRERAAGSVTWMLCRCQRDLPLGEQRVMTLVDDAIRRVSAARSNPTPQADPGSQPTATNDAHVPK